MQMCFGGEQKLVQQSAARDEYNLEVEEKKKEATHDLSPRPAMTKELFWQGRTSREVAMRRCAEPTC